jgi:hypothetical protein
LQSITKEKKEEAEVIKQPLPQQRQSSPALNSFIYPLKSSESQRQYPGRLKQFFDFLGLPGPVEEQAEAFLHMSKSNDTQWTQNCIIDFVNYHKQRITDKKLAAGTLNNYYMATKLFCEMNDLATAINWKRISRGLPRMKTSANDRAPTVEEIRKLVEYPDRRIKAIVYSMVSGGFRLGSWKDLCWKHVTPITDEKTGEVIAAKLIIYPGEPEQYYTFITPEAYNAFKTWMDFRASYGEKILVILINLFHKERNSLVYYMLESDDHHICYNSLVKPSSRWIVITSLALKLDKDKWGKS